MGTSAFRRVLSASLSALLLLTPACNGGGGGGGDGTSVDTSVGQQSWILRWNEIAIDASGIDHQGNREQMGPVRAARAIAIVHIAMADAVAAVSGKFHSYMPTPEVPANTSLKAAIAQAGHDTLVALFPRQAASFDSYLAEDLAHVTDEEAKTNGVALGQVTASEILKIREKDGAELSEPYAVVNHTTSDEPGHWRLDPINPGQKPLGAYWWKVKPFLMSSADQFRLPPPPAMDSPEYAAAYEEVKRVGGDGIVTPTERTEDQTVAGLFWAYDGTPTLCAPPRLYNQIAVHIGKQRGLDIVEFARFLALLNLSMAEAGLASWDSKYFHDFWRPVTGIREADEGTGPSGRGDGNPATVGDPTFIPFGAPASNLTGPNFTPPFPAYPSGHATFGGAIFQTMRNFFGTDDIEFTFVSDELNGVTADNTGIVRPRLERTFHNLSEAEEENGQSRIYLGIHWSFDKTGGITQGRNVANFVYSNAYQPIQ